MKAAVLEHYDKNGAPLVMKDVPNPEPSADQVLVRVATAGVNPLDNMIIRKEVKLIVPYTTPLIMGNEFVGTIEEVGEDVSDFHKGDRVYGRMPLDSIGAFAQYAAVSQDAIALVPDYLTDEEAACVPLTALTALQAYGLMRAQRGQSIFISGATGSLGAMAVPIAKAIGLTVYANGNGVGQARLEHLGVDRFIDYKEQDFAVVLKDANVDYVLDSLGDKALAEEFSILNRGGTLVSLKGMPNRAFAERMGFPWWKCLLFGLAGGKYDRMATERDQCYEFMFVHGDGVGLEEVSRIFEAERIQPSVDGIFALEEVNEALAKVASGKSNGKTVLRIA